MITIESDALLTIAVAVVSTVVSSFITWQYSKRRYSRASKQVTEEDLKLEKVKNEFRSELLVLILFLALIFGVLAFFALLILNRPTP